MYFLPEALLKASSKARMLDIASWIGNDPERFAQLMQAFLDGPMRLNQRAAGVLSHVIRREPHLIAPYHTALLQRLAQPTHNAVIRNTVRIWQWVPLPDSASGAIANYCMAYLNNPKEAIAIRAFSMGVLFRLGQQWPEIQEELTRQLEVLLPGEKSAALKNRGHKILNGTYQPEFH